MRRFNKFLEKFPPPEFLNVPFIGVVFSDSNIRVLSLDKNNMHPVFSAELALPDGTIEAGEVKKPEEVAKVLQSLPPKFKTPFVKFAVPDEISYIFSAQVPVSPGKDATESISFILEENVPLPLADISFDFTPLKVEKNGDGFSANVVVTALSTRAMDGYIKSLNLARMEPIFCTNESQAIARAIVPEEDEGNFAIIYIHRNIVGIYITDKRQVEFSSILMIPPNSSPELFTSFVTVELKKSLDYWLDKNSRMIRAEKIKCFLCGKHDMCKILLDNSEKLDHAELSLGNIWINAFSLEDYIPDISFEDSLGFGGAVGLFLS